MSEVPFGVKGILLGTMIVAAGKGAIEMSKQVEKIASPPEKTQPANTGDEANNPKSEFPSSRQLREFMAQHGVKNTK
jgi:hypothetical protein